MSLLERTRRPVVTFDVITANANGDDYPRLPTSNQPHRILFTQELNERLLRAHYPKMRHRVDDRGYHLAISATRGKFARQVREVEAVKFHSSGRRLNIAPGIRTPARGVLRVDCIIAGHDVSLLDTHLINSAYPVRASKRDRWTAERRVLWDQSWAELCDVVDDLHDAGRLGILAGDFNRMHCPPPPGMVWAGGSGLDAIFVSRHADLRIIPGSERQGPRAGHSGKVHHHSESVTLALTAKKEK